MTPQEAENLMSPFYPHDPNLAIKAIGTALGGNVPEWILESVVGSYFTYRTIEDFDIRMLELVEAQEDPFGLHTIPYHSLKHGLSRTELN